MTEWGHKVVSKFLGGVGQLVRKVLRSLQIGFGWEGQTLEIGVVGFGPGDQI